ncbi:glutathione S-transferase [Roseomonas arctica]|uniref:Glutathione S-transferase n=1 Tax=Plastoroseomonas arctica TaxID=1509237 RepID=A0AAF1KUT1_9PROT|nr:glutathione S-transferase [Plastoroseomonas arctica]
MLNDMYELISATPSPYARKVRIALIEKGIAFTLRTEVPWHADTATPAYNPLEKLPVLVLPDGQGIYESRFILEWLEVHYPDPPLLPRDPVLALQARQIEVICDGICDATVLLFFERRREAPSAPWMARQRRKIDGGLSALERLAGPGFLVDDRFGLADICVGTVLRYLTVRYPDHPWRDTHSGLVAMSGRLETRASFAASVPVPQSIVEAVV